MTRFLLPLAFLSYALGCLAITLFLSANPLPSAPIEPRIVLAPLPDFAAYNNVKEKKQAFFDYLRPAIEQSNRDQRLLKKTLQGWQQSLASGQSLNSEQKLELASLCKRYKVDTKNTSTKKQLDLLLNKVGPLPASMVLAQAALESAWGTSRFAREANNIFGQWCFSPRCGLVPKRRPQGATYEVKTFDSISAAVDAYFVNINAHKAYGLVRELRRQADGNGQKARGTKLVAGLEKYSGRGRAYIDELRSLIRYNGLEEQP